MFHIIVADQKVLRVFEQGDADGALRELTVLRNPEAVAHERDLVADRPGRVASSASGSRQTYTPRVSARDIALQRWLKLASRQAATLLAARRSEGCVLAAAPRLLGELRATLPSTMTRRAIVELPRDLAKAPVRDVQRRAQASVQELRTARARVRSGTARSSQPGAGARA